MNETIKNPYVGPRTFQESERDRFYGREREARDLLALAVSEQLILFYAQSGAGKSSLVNTCLIPDLREKGFDIYTGRVGGDAPSGVVVDNIFVFNLASSLVANETDPGSLTKLTLGETFAKLKSNMHPPEVMDDGDGQAPKPHTLIIDQFEEIFSTHHEAWEKREEFFQQLAQAIQDDLYLWIVLVMREDFIASLDPYVRLLPGRLRMRYYMQQLERGAALEAIKKPVKELRPYAAGVAEKLVDDLCSVKVYKLDQTLGIQPGQYVEPVQLQVICYNLWEKLPPGTQITEKDLQDVGDVNASLGSYYAERVKAIAETKHIEERKIRTWFTEKLISPSGMRNMVLQEPDGRSGGLDNHIIQELHDLVRAEQRGGAIFYELTHDRLVRPILDNNEKWDEKNLSILKRQAVLWDQQGRSDGLLLRSRELMNAEREAKLTDLTDTEKAFLSASRKLKAQEDRDRARNRWLVILTFGAVVAMCTAVVLGLFSWSKTIEAQQQEAIALASNATAVSSEATALASNQIADEQLRMSDSLRLALQAQLLLIDDVNSSPELVALLSIRSLKGAYIPEADTALTEGLNRLYAVYTFEGHTNIIRSIAVSPNGKFMATGGDDNTARLWDLETGEELHVFEGHTNGISSLAFSPDSKYLLTGSYDKTARVWDLSTFKVVHTLNGHTGTILSVAFSPDGSYILTGSNDKTAKLWDAESGKELRAFIGHGEAIRDVAFSSSGDYVLSGSDDDTAKLWDFDSGQVVYTFTGYEHDIYAVDISPDDKQIVVGGLESGAMVWDIESHKKLLTLTDHRNTVDDVVFSNRGDFILTGSFDGTAILWDSKTGKILRTFMGHLGWVQGVAFSTDDRYVFTGSADTTAKMWLASENRTSRVFASDDEINKVVFSQDGKFILTGDNNDHAKIWSVATGNRIQTYVGHTNKVDAIAISSDGKYILTGSLDNSAKLWNAETGEEVRTYKGHTSSIWGIAISADNRYVLTGSADKTAKLWDLESGAVIRTFEGHEAGIDAVAFSPDGKYILTGSADKTAKLWYTEYGTEFFTIKHSQTIWSVAFSPDGKYILTGSLDNTAKLWDAKTGVEIRVFKGHDDRVFGAAFSPDGKYILTGSADNTAKLWETETGKEVRTLVGHTDKVYSVAFSPDGKYLVTASADGTARLWDFDYHATIELACSVLTRDLTSEERQEYEISDDSPTCPNQQTMPILPERATPTRMENLLYDGNISEALTLLERTRELDPGYVEKFDADFWNRFCWFGSLNGYPKDVKDYCEKAVKMLPDNGNVRDSRGVNRALLGDYVGAIEDFEYAIEWFPENDYPERVQKRESWVLALQEGRNPFDAETLELLKTE